MKDESCFEKKQLKGLNFQGLFAKKKLSPALKKIVGKTDHWC